MRGLILFACVSLFIISSLVCVADSEARTPLILEGDTVLVLDGEDLFTVNEIELHDHAQLIIRNADLVMTRIDPREDWGVIRAWDDSRVELTNASATGDVDGLWVTAFDSATILLDGVECTFSADVYGSAHAEIRNCDPQELRIGDRGTLIAQNVAVGWVIDFHLDDQPTFELADLQQEAEIEERVFGPDQGFPFRLELHDVFVNGWSVHISRDTDVRLVDSVFERIVLSQERAQGTLTNLRPQLYEHWIYPDDLNLTSDLRVELVNTEMADHWVFHVYGNARLEIIDCENIFFSFGSGYANLDISNCEIRGFSIEDAMADLQFANTRIDEAFEIRDCVWITMSGELSFGADARVERWENSTVQRTYPLQLTSINGTPAAGYSVGIILADGSTRTLTTDSTGMAELTVIHDDQDYDESIHVSVDPGDRPIERNISFLSGTPVAFDFLRASIDPTTLYVGIDRTLESFYPAESPLRGHVYETLYTLDATNHPLPLLAVSVPSFGNGGIVMNEDGSYTITVQPRSGVVFHSGDPMTLEDIEYCLEEQLIVAGGPLVPDALEAIGVVDLEGAIATQGAEAVVTKIHDAIRVESGQIVIELERPYSGLWAFLADIPIAPRSWLISHGCWDGSSEDLVERLESDDFTEFSTRDGIGTGPFALETVSDDGRDAALIRNASYWGTLPKLERVLISFDRSPRELIDLLDAEKLDLVVDMPNDVLQDDRLAEDMLAEVGTLKPVTLEDQPGSMWGIFNQLIVQSDRFVALPSGEFGVDAAPVDLFTDLDVRLGFLHSFDWSTYVDEARDKGWLLRPVGTPIAHLLTESHVAGVEYTYDPDLARQHFLAAWDGQLAGTGFTTYACFNGGNMARRDFSDTLSASIAAINERYVVDQYDPDFNTVVAGLFDDAIPLAVLGLTEDIDLLTLPYLLLHSGGLYPAGASVPAFDELLEHAAWTLDLDVRDATMNELRDRVAADPIGFFWRGQRWVVEQEWVRGRTYDPFYAFGQVPDFNLSSVWKDVP